jgi:hypothetical protein
MLGHELVGAYEQGELADAVVPGVRQGQDDQRQVDQRRERGDRSSGAADDRAEREARPNVEKPRLLNAAVTPRRSGRPQAQACAHTLDQSHRLGLR